MKFNFPKLNNQQLTELAKVCLDIGKAIFLGSVAAFFIPSLTDKNIPAITLIIGSITSLIFVLIGLILLKEKQK